MARQWTRCWLCVSLYPHPIAPIERHSVATDIVCSLRQMACLILSMGPNGIYEWNYCGLNSNCSLCTHDDDSDGWVDIHIHTYSFIQCYCNEIFHFAEKSTSFEYLWINRWLTSHVLVYENIKSNILQFEYFYLMYRFVILQCWRVTTIHGCFHLNPVDFDRNTIPKSGH